MTHLATIPKRVKDKCGGTSAKTQSIGPLVLFQIKLLFSSLVYLSLCSGANYVFMGISRTPEQDRVNRNLKTKPNQTESQSLRVCPA